MYHLTAEANVTAEVKTLARAKTLAAMATRLRKDGEWWGERGWDVLIVEGLTVEHLKAELKAGRLSFADFKELKAHTA